MSRPSFRHSLRFENLESRQLLSGMAVTPTAQEQYMLESINAARANPRAAAQQVTSNLTPDIVATLNHYNVDLNAAKSAIANSPAKAPLAWNPDLAQAAESHSQDMANNQYQSHTGSDGSTPEQRIQTFGYTNAKSLAENAYAYASSVDEAMQAFLIDWGVADQGHRRNILQANVSQDDASTDVGIGIVSSTGKVGPLVVTQNFGKQSGNTMAQLLGVAYDDTQKAGRFTLNSGRGNVQIDATNLATGVTSSTQTWDSGGYQMTLSPGRYQVTASVNNKVIKSTPVTIGTDNVDQDFVLTDTWDGRSRDEVINSLAPKTVQIANVSAPVVTVSTKASTEDTPAVTLSTKNTPVVAVSTQAVAEDAPDTTSAAARPTVSLKQVAVNATVAPTQTGSWTSWKAKKA